MAIRLRRMRYCGYHDAGARLLVILCIRLRLLRPVRFVVDIGAWCVIGLKRGCGLYRRVVYEFVSGQAPPFKIQGPNLALRDGQGFRMRFLFSPAAKGVESGVKGRQIRRPFHSDCDLLRSLNLGEMAGETRTPTSGHSTKGRLDHVTSQNQPANFPPV
jgi:hypothetical protein